MSDKKCLDKQSTTVHEKLERLMKQLASTIFKMKLMSLMVMMAMEACLHRFLSKLTNSMRRYDA